MTASKFADGGSSAKTPLSIISLSQTLSLTDGMTGSSQSSSSSGEGEKSKRRLEKGKERDMGDKDSDDADRDDRDPSDDPDDPPGDQDGTIAVPGPTKISFEVASEIYPIQDEGIAFQTLTMHGSLTIKVLLFNVNM